MAVTIGFLVAITSSVAPAFAAAYDFSAWQIGLCFISSLVGSGIGIIFGGQATDIVADYFTRRNKGLREPEFRLPAIAISCITAPLALILYGFGIQHQWHWIVPTIGLGLRKSYPYISRDLLK
jgi:MFS family permease